MAMVPPTPGPAVPPDRPAPPDGGLQGGVTDATGRHIFEDALRMLAECSTSASPEAFFDPMLRHVGDTLGAHFVCVNRLDLSRREARSLRVLLDGQFLDNLRYSLDGSPCDQVIGRDVRVFPRQVQAQFPDFALLRQVDAQSYVGVTLWGRKRTPIGLLVAVGRRPWPDIAQAQTLLQLLAGPAAAEIERMDAEAALRASNQELSLRSRQLERTLDSIAQGVAMKDASGRMVFLSRRAMELLELPPALQDASHAEITRFQHERGDFGPHYSLVEGPAQAYVRAGGQDYQDLPGTYTRRTQAGRTLEVRTLPLAEGGWVRTYADVTDYMQAIADRSASEALWKFALEGSGAGVWDWDPVHAEGRYSPLYKTLLGYPADFPDAELPRWEDRLHPGRPPGRDGGAAAPLRGLFADLRQRAPGALPGRQHPVDARARHGGQPGRPGCADPHRRHRHRHLRPQAGRASAEPGGQRVHAHDGRHRDHRCRGTIVEVNDAFSRITGYRHEEAVGQTPRILSSGRQGPEFYAGMWGALLATGQWSGEIWNRRKNGEVYAEILTINAVRNAAGPRRTMWRCSPTSRRTRSMSASSSTSPTTTR
jgi:PAS domain S-box-containing protein